MDVLATFRRRWFVIVLLFVVCAGAAGVYSKLATKIYRASTLISVTAARFDYGNGLAAQGLLDNYAVQMTGQQLLGQLNQQLQLDKTPEQLAKEINAVADNTAFTIALSVDDTDPRRAADIANGLTNLFVTTIREYNLAHLNPDVAVKVIHSATVPGGPNRPKSKINVLAGGLLGLLLGAGAAYLLDTYDDRVRSEYDVEHGLQMPLLGAVPPLPVASIVTKPVSGVREDSKAPPAALVR
ncbi:MAG: Wzz/FepE/Etk N-terminal domain-containing protein [Chloroflexi bacterium]|nr:Wzz/FepE/Etk N-terminal domain-containing protein [Chloroflexota bacterium]